MTEEWLSLSEMAEELGVHPSTVRKWADSGDLPVHRTPGGHRRFRRQEVDLWKQAQGTESPEEAHMVINKAINEIRFKISEGHLENETWYQKLDERARQQYRLSGRSLLQGLRAYLAAEGEDAQSEAESLGYEYASRGRQYGLNALEAMQAFLFFRNSLLESMLKIYEAASIQSPYIWSNMFRRINTFTDKIMISLLEIYHALEHKN